MADYLSFQALAVCWQSWSTVHLDSIPRWSCR